MPPTVTASAPPGSLLRDSTFAALREGYVFISNRCDRYASNVFRTRLLGQETICLRGEAAAQLFYDETRFQRGGAAPVRMKQTLVGRRTLQGLDGEAHRVRKRMFMSLMSAARIEQLSELMIQYWLAAVPAWERRNEPVRLFHEAGTILCQAVCAWAGVPLPAGEVEARARDIRVVIDGTGGVGPRHWRGRIARKRCDTWMHRTVEAVRRQELKPAEGSALHAIAWARDERGELLGARTAGEELFNVIRPTVAVDRFVTFSALALHAYPKSRDLVMSGGNREREWFVQEVRRFYPFFPFAVARVRETFEWNGFLFPHGVRVLLDLYGTDHDPRLWQDPDQFRPERFRDWKGGAFNFIPQGGGDHDTGHRCAGEWITIELIKTAVRLLTAAMRYDVPPQDLRVRLSRMPALPESGFFITNIRGVGGGR